MKKFVIAGVITSAFAAGCVVEEDPPCSDLGPCITADILLDSAGPGSITYQTGDGLRVNARLSGTASGFMDIYDPQVRALRTPPLTAGFGVYDLWIDYINDARGSVVVVDSTNMVTVDVQNDVHVDADLLLGNGFLMANWTINGGATTCAQATGQTGVSILGTLQSDQSIHEDIYSCPDGYNNPNPVVTDPNPIGSYVVAACLIDGAMACLNAPTTVNSTIVDGNDYNDLGVIDMTFP